MRILLMKICFYLKKAGYIGEESLKIDDKDIVIGNLRIIKLDKKEYILQTSQDIYMFTRRYKNKTKELINDVVEYMMMSEDERYEDIEKYF